MEWLVHVDGGVDGPPVRRPLAVAAGVRVTGGQAIIFEPQPGPAWGDVLNSGRNFFGRGRRRLERDRARLAVRRINGSNRCGVRLPREANRGTHSRAPIPTY